MKKSLGTILLIVMLMPTCLAELNIVGHKKISSNQIEVEFSSILANEPITGIITTTENNTEIKAVGFGNSKDKIVILTSPYPIPDKYTLKIKSAKDLDGFSIKDGQPLKTQEASSGSIDSLIDSYNSNSGDNNNSDIENLENSNNTDNINNQDNNTGGTNIDNTEDSDNNIINNNENIEKTNTQDENVSNGDNTELKYIEGAKYDNQETKNKQIFIVLGTLLSIFLIGGMFIVSRTPKKNK